MIGQIRSYFSSRLSEVGTFREWTDGFNFENIPRPIYNKSYHLNIDVINSEPLADQKIQDNVSVTVRLFYRSNKHNQDEYDNMLDVAHEFRRKSMAPQNFRLDSNIVRVVCDTITPEFLLDNDNALIVTINFSVTMVFALN